MPEDLWLYYAILRESVFLPRELELLNEITALEAELSAGTSGMEAASLRKIIRERRLSYNLVREPIQGRGRRQA